MASESENKFQIILNVASEKRIEKEPHYEQFREHRLETLKSDVSDMIAKEKKRSQRRIQWQRYTDYFKTNLAGNVSLLTMAAYIGGLENVYLTDEDIIAALRYCGIKREDDSNGGE